ncbi:hypothetical protein M5K25_005449 [Dendrobium thyrsiflorum]|uniref:Uncharacterized protein n=1 Tax=Dendrobium thyrsiflorum TaxID=117978 RepID=A0ABD0VIQ8_DENTH
MTKTEQCLSRFHVVGTSLRAKNINNGKVCKDRNDSIGKKNLKSIVNNGVNEKESKVECTTCNCSYKYLQNAGTHEFSKTSVYCAPRSEAHALEEIEGLDCLPISPVSPLFLLFFCCKQQFTCRFASIFVRKSTAVFRTGEEEIAEFFLRSEKYPSYFGFLGMAAKKVDALEERLEGEMNQIKETVEERMSSMEGQVADLRDMMKKMLEFQTQSAASDAKGPEAKNTNSEIHREEEEVEIVEGRRGRPHLEPFQREERGGGYGERQGYGAARTEAHLPPYSLHGLFSCNPLSSSAIFLLSYSQTGSCPLLSAASNSSKAFLCNPATKEMSSSVSVVGNSNSIALPAILTATTLARIESSFQHITKTFQPISSGCSSLEESSPRLETVQLTLVITGAIITTEQGKSPSSRPTETRSNHGKANRQQTVRDRNSHGKTNRQRPSTQKIATRRPTATSQKNIQGEEQHAATHGRQTATHSHGKQPRRAKIREQKPNSHYKERRNYF